MIKTITFSPKGKALVKWPFMELFEEAFPEANPDHDIIASNEKETNVPTKLNKVRIAMCRYEQCQETFSSQPCAAAMTWTRSIGKPIF